LAVLVSSSAPLDQYFALSPDMLMGAAVEQARIDPDNLEILIQHLKCAAFELPFSSGEAFGDVPSATVDAALTFLSAHGVVHDVVQSGTDKKVYHWATDAYPANHVSLRSVGWDNVVIVDVSQDETLAEMDWRSSHTMLHEQAIYQHAGEQYQVERFDYDNHKAFVRKVAPDYYTDAMTHTRIGIMEREQEAALQTPSGVPVSVCCGEVSVVEKVVGYKKIKYHTHENVGYGEVTLPEIQMHTTACWLTLPEALTATLPYSRPQVMDGVVGLAHAMHTVSAVGLMIDPRDVGRSVGDDADEKSAGDGVYDPTLFLFDHIPGGIGLAPRIFEDHGEVLRRTRRLIESCPCLRGCPACVGPTLAEGGVRKAVCLAVMGALGVGAAAA
jgi:DEAD/DEAH box helicase domain-containing protein